MRKVVSLAVLLAVISMLFLNAAAEIGIIESPNIDIIQMETEQLDEAWLYKHVEASPEDTYKELMKAIYIISSMQYGPYSNYEDVPSHDLSMDAITEWLDALSFEHELENTEFGACMRFSGSLSNVGVRADGEQNSCPEGTEVSEAEGEAFEGFDGVVAALSKSIGQVNVECVQDVWPPVGKHSAAGPELWKIQLVAGFQPEVEPVFGFGPVGCCHEVVERLLEGVCLQKLVGEAEHRDGQAVVSLSV